MVLRALKSAMRRIRRMPLQSQNIVTVAYFENMIIRIRLTYKAWKYDSASSENRTTSLLI